MRPGSLAGPDGPPGIGSFFRLGPFLEGQCLSGILRERLLAAKAGGEMSDRSLIFDAKGAQIAYIEGDRAFDLTGRERCKYARATGNLSELNGERIVGTCR